MTDLSYLGTEDPVLAGLWTQSTLSTLDSVLYTIQATGRIAAFQVGNRGMNPEPDPNYGKTPLRYLPTWDVSLSVRSS